jgi:hypothetical protein
VFCFPTYAWTQKISDSFEQFLYLVPLHASSPLWVNQGKMKEQTKTEANKPCD